MARIGLIGCGMWGRNLARNLGQLGALTQIADQQPERAAAFADEFGGAVSSIDAIADTDDLDGVMIATPAFTHAALACRALAAGRHVYVEKPLAMSLDEAARIAEAARKADRNVMVGHLIRYHAAFIALQTEIAAGTIGDLRHVVANRLAMGRIRRNESVIHDLCPHDTSLLLALMGEEPGHLSCAGVSHVTPGIIDHVSASFAFSGNRTASINTSWISPYKEHRLTAFGSTGSIVFDDTRPWSEKLSLFRDDMTPAGDGVDIKRAEPAFIPVAESEPLRAEVSHFVECCATGSRPLTDITEGLAVQRVLERMTESITAFGQTHTPGGSAATTRDETKTA